MEPCTTSARTRTPPPRRREGRGRLSGHEGPHPKAYHQESLRREREATLTCRSKGSCRQALTQELRRIAQGLTTPGHPLRRLLTEH
ncbi:AHH domain-containing protein [Pyxidicoccus sp. 3LG]